MSEKFGSGVTGRARFRTLTHDRYQTPGNVDKKMSQYREHNGKLQKLVFCRYKTVNGIRKYHPKGKLYVFWVDVA